MNILVTQPRGDVRDSFFSEEAVRGLEKLGNVMFNDSENDYTNEELAELIKDVDVLVTGWFTTMIDANILANANSLKIVAHTGGTVARTVGQEVYDRGIRVLSGNQVFAESVAEGTLCYILCALRRIVHYTNVMNEGGWKEPMFKNQGLFEKTVGIVGFGTIAKHLCRMLAPFNVKLKVFSPSMSSDVAEQYGMEIVTLEEIFASCDIISIHCALNDNTHHMIDANMLSKIRDGALLVNTSRGAVIDEAALVEELEKGRFTAFLDVYEIEPPPKESRLRSLDNAILMPHMGGPTIEHRKVVTKRLVKSIESVINGESTELEITAEMAMKMTR